MDNEEILNVFKNLNIDPSSISQDKVNNLLNMIGNNNGNNSGNVNNTEPVSFNNQNVDLNMLNGIDMETFLRMKSMIDKMNNNSNDPYSNLLSSLKPYLRESRRGTLDQISGFMKMSKMMEGFSFNFGGDKKDNGQ